MDRLFEDLEDICVRFACDCLHPAHGIDLSVETWDEGNQVSIDFHADYVPNGTSLWQRTKDALKVLSGRRIWGHSVSVRLEDIPAMIDVLRKALPDIPSLYSTASTEIR